MSEGFDPSAKPPPRNGQPGTAHDGTPVLYSEQMDRWVPAASAKSLGIKPLQAGGPGPAGGVLANNPDYQKFFSQWAGKQDAESYGKANDAMMSGADALAQSDQARSLIQADTPSGTGGTLGLIAGKTLGPYIGGHFGVPTTDQATNMATLRRLGGKGALGDVQFMKGSLSDADRAFLQSLQYGVGQSPQYNLKVADAQGWAAKKQIAYAAGLQAWVNKLGSPMAVAPSGETFQQWWLDYSNRALPRPDLVSRPAGDRTAQNKALQDQSAAAKKGPKLLGVESP